MNGIKETGAPLIAMVVASLALVILVLV